MVNSSNISSLSTFSYDPFGMITTGRSWEVGSEYRYGFNNQEIDKKIVNVASTIAFEFRNYNPQIARFFSVDPLQSKYPMYTPYSFSANQPIHARDLEGLENPDDKNTTVPPCSNLTSDSNSGWSISGEPGWVTGENLTNPNWNSTGIFEFNGEDAHIVSDFSFYDSRENLLKFEGDQANHYLFSINYKFEGSTKIGMGLNLTTGVIHDKAQTLPNAPDNLFKYTNGGTSPALLLGVDVDLNLPKIDSYLDAGIKYGNYQSFNDIKVDITSSTNVTYTKEATGSIIDKISIGGSGSGSVALINATFNYIISNSWSASLSVNGTYMTGYAFANVTATDNNSGNISNGVLSIQYSSHSLGLALGATYKFR